jgi:signal transduction histidine kinase
LGIWLGLAFVLAFGLVRVVSLGWASGSSLDQGMELVVFPVLLLTVIGALADVARRYRTLLAEQGEHIERLDSAVQELSEANLGFQRYADFVAERSTADERNRITREVHDTTIYALTNLKMMLEAAGYMAQGESKKLKALLKNAYTQAREGIENTRSALRALRTINTRGIGNYKAIQRIAEAYQAATGVTVEIQYGNLPRETLPEIDRFMYRFVQEGMTNAFRHGRATHILLLFWIDNDTLTISLHDNGRGAPSLNEGIGLRGMRERISELEGELKVQNVQSGFKLIARIPYPRASETGASKTGASKESTSETGAAENQEPGEPQEVSYDADRTGRRPDAVRG